jgi:hypothetical protein
MQPPFEQTALTIAGSVSKVLFELQPSIGVGHFAKFGQRFYSKPSWPNRSRVAP